MRVVTPASIFRFSGTLSAVTALFLGTTLLAQEPGSNPVVKPTTQPTSKPTAVDAMGKPVVEEAPPRELTPQERLASLQVTLEKLKRERLRLQNIEKNGGLGPRVVQRVKRRNVRGDETMQLGPALPKPKHARLLGDAERKELAEDVIFTVDSLPVTQKDFDSLYGYLRSYPRQQTAAAIKAETILTLVKARAAEAAGKDNTAKALAAIKKIHSQIEAGSSFGDLAKQHSQDNATAAKGGDLGYITRQHSDMLCAQTLFTMNLGQVSAIVRGTDGFYLLRVRGAKRGDTADKDRVRASHILVLYTPDAAGMKKAMERVANADVDLAFREKELREFAPKQFK